MHTSDDDRERNALEEALYRAAEYGAGRPRTFDVPADARVEFGSPGSLESLFDGMTISWASL